MSTIVSISTALGKGAISIVRLSGDEAIDIVKEFGSEDSFKFVNAVLDNIRKEVQ